MFVSVRGVKNKTREDDRNEKNGDCLLSYKSHSVSFRKFHLNKLISGAEKILLPKLVFRLAGRISVQQRIRNRFLPPQIFFVICRTAPTYILYRERNDTVSH